MARFSYDRSVQFLRAEIVDDGFQSRRGEYRPHGPRCWAAKSEISDAEKFGAGSVVPNLQARFRLPWSNFAAGIAHTDRMACEGRVYAIVGIKEIGRRAALEFTTASVTP